MRAGSHERPPPAWATEASMSTSSPAAVGSIRPRWPSALTTTGALRCASISLASRTSAEAGVSPPMATPLTVVPLGTRSLVTR